MQLIKNKKVKLNDVSLSYLVKEAAEPVQHTILFIHGFPFDRNSWRPQLEELPSSIRGISVDVRGHGLSTAGHGFFSIDVFAKDLIALLIHLNLSKVILCGVSMGGYIALRLQQLLPKAISGLILSDTQHKADDNTAKQKRFDSIQALLKHGKRPFALGFIANLFANIEDPANYKAVELIKNSINKNSIRNICATQLALAARTDSTAYLKNIQVPTLLIRGSKDSITSKAVMEEMHQNISNATLIEIENAGHLPNLEQPDVFNQALLHFLAKNTKQ